MVYVIKFAKRIFQTILVLLQTNWLIFIFKMDIFLTKLLLFHIDFHGHKKKLEQTNKQPRARPCLHIKKKFSKLLNSSMKQLKTNI